MLAPVENYARADKADFDPYIKFNEASVLYSESRFKDALYLYEELLKHGYESGALYYNIANTYLKLGILGKAILNYERALRIMPHDIDLKSNLRYANSLKQQPAMAEASPLWINRRIGALLGFFTVDGLTKILFATYIFTALLLIAAVLKKSKRGIIYKFAIMFGVFFMIMITFLSFKIYQERHVDSGIILIGTAEARFEPLKEAPIHFKLYEGAKIVILRTRGEWSQIKRKDNKIGWIESGFYDII